MLVDGFIEASGKAFSEVSDSKGIVDIKMCMANEFFKICNVAIGILRIHLEALHDGGPGLFFLQNVGVLLTKRCDGTVV